MNIFFKNQVALVTGAASGLGLATATAFAESGASVVLADWHEGAVHSAAEVLAGMDRYYCGQPPRRQWIATQLVRRLADPHPSDFSDDQWSEPDARAEWDEVRQRCLSVAVAMLEEAR